MTSSTDWPRCWAAKGMKLELPPKAAEIEPDR